MMVSQSNTPNPAKGEIDAIVAEAALRCRALSELDRWRSQGKVPDAKAVLDQHPELAEHKSIVLGLAYEEFCRRTETGEAVDRDAFCSRFPVFQRSLRRLLEVHDYLEENPHVVPPIQVDWPEAGQTFRGFSILTELGRGAFGRVYLAEEIALGRRLVAIKASIEGAVEAEILGRLQHPGIVPVYSVLPADETGVTIVCMPYLGHITLFDLVEELFQGEDMPKRSRAIIEAIRIRQSGTLPAGDATGSMDGELCHGSYVDGALHLGAQLAEALAYSHSRGICHSDLKPSNVLITPGGRPMLLDFNLAFDPQSLERRLGGTLPYMAPEQLLAMDGASLEARAEIGERSDIFSLGVILYELLCGQLPFGPVAADRPSDLVRQHLLECQRRGPMRLREVNQDVDRSLAHLIERCLAFHPHQRPTNAEELANALRAGRSTGRRVRRWTRRHYVMTLGAAASIVAGSMAIGYHWATRAPYDVRTFNRAGEAFEGGDYLAAEAHLDRVIAAGGSNDLLADALFWRARARLKLGRNLEAIKDLKLAVSLRPDGRTHACLGYAYALERVSHDSALCLSEALAAGFRTAEVYAGFGYASLFARTPMMRRAIELLDKALQLKPNLVSARYLRALGHLFLSRKLRQSIDPQAIDDIEAVMASHPEDPYIYYDAAAIFERCEERSERTERRIVDCLCRALQLGVDPKLVHANFPKLVEQPRVREALALEVPVAKRNMAAYLADPVAREPFPFR